MTNQRIEMLDSFYASIQSASQLDTLNFQEVSEDIYKLTPNIINKTQKIALIAITHGNEWAGVGIFHAWLELLIKGTIQLEQEVFLILGNKEAYLKDRRFIEKDLNRVYGQSSGDTLEEKRVSQIKQVLDQCDMSLDFHQTVEPTNNPFFIFPEHQATLAFAKELYADMPIVSNPPPLVPTTSSSYMTHHNKIGITVEVGDYGFNEAHISLGLYMINKTLGVKQTEPEPIIPFNHGKQFAIIFHKTNNKDSVTFREGLKHFDFIRQGEQIGQINDEPLICEQEGYILLYPPVMINDTKHPSDGIYILLTERS